MVGNHSNIIAHTKIFYNVDVEGTWNCVGNAAWWATGSGTEEIHWTDEKGAHTSTLPNNVDDHDNIQQALDSSFSELVFPPRMYYTENTLILRKGKKIVLQGGAMSDGMDMLKWDEIRNTAIIYTDKDIDLLVINVTENGENPSTVSIEGGNFDVSRIIAGNEFIKYTKSCIKVLADDYNARLWGLTINTNIFGCKSGDINNRQGFGININPVKAIEQAEYKLDNYGYVTQMSIKGTIKNFDTGIIVKNHYNSNGQ